MDNWSHWACLWFPSYRGLISYPSHPLHPLRCRSVSALHPRTPSWFPPAHLDHHPLFSPSWHPHQNSTWSPMCQPLMPQSSRPPPCNLQCVFHILKNPTESPFHQFPPPSPTYLHCYVFYRGYCQFRSIFANLIQNSPNRVAGIPSFLPPFILLSLLSSLPPSLPFLFRASPLLYTHAFKI